MKHEARVFHLGVPSKVPGTQALSNSYLFGESRILPSWVPRVLAAAQSPCSCTPGQPPKDATLPWRPSSRSITP